MSNQAEQREGVLRGYQLDIVQTLSGKGLKAIKGVHLGSSQGFWNVLLAVHSLEQKEQAM